MWKGGLGGEAIRADITAPPCFPVAPVTRMRLKAMVPDLMFATSVQVPLVPFPSGAVSMYEQTEEAKEKAISK